MKYILDNITLDLFFKIFRERETENIDLLEKNRAITKGIVNQHIKKTKQHIIAHIKPNAYEILNLLNTDYYNRLEGHFRYSMIDKDEAEKEASRLQNFHYSLKRIIDYLSIIESLSFPEANLEINTISEKSDFILDKLNVLFDDDNYSISTLLLKDYLLGHMEQHQV